MEASYKHSYKTGENLLNSLSVYNVGYQKCDPEYQWGPGSERSLLYSSHFVRGADVIVRELCQSIWKKEIRLFSIRE